jgi:hypothetical protein
LREGAYDDLEMMEKAFLIFTQLFITAAMWSFHSSFASIVTPRNLLGILWSFRNRRGSSPGL